MESKGQEEAKEPSADPNVSETGPKAPESSLRLKNMRGTSQMGRLSVRGDINFGIPTNQGAAEHVEETHGSDSWRMRILQTLHNPKVQTAMMFLLLLDVIILFVELYLTAQYPPCHIIERDCISCCAPDQNMTDHNTEHFRFLAEVDSNGAHDDHHGVCESGLEADYHSGGCDSHKWEHVHNAELVLFSLTVTILFVFLVENNLEMVALGPTIFFRQFFYALDYLIVTVSLGLELSLFFINEEALATLFGLLVFARVWRFVRIGHGIVEIATEWTHQQYEELLDYAEEMEKIIREHNLELPTAPESVQKSISQHGHSSH